MEVQSQPQVTMSNNPTYADLFCGAGGLSLGLRRAGFHEVFASDKWSAAVAVYRENLFPGAVAEEISIDTALPNADVIVGGPPCQGFSSAGMRKNGDRRNSLVSVFAEIIARERPQAFVFENVEGFLTAEGGDRVVDLLKPLVDAGYRIHLRKINAANYGVPQHRKRVIGIGGLGWNPSFPSPRTFAEGAPGADAIGRGLPNVLGVSAALAGLPPASSSEPGDPQGHVATRLSHDDLRRARWLEPGMTMRDLPLELQHESYQRRANRRVRDGTPTERRGGAPAGLRRLAPDLPSKAITGGARSDFLHPFEDRRLTVRECARLQTFPDDFVFRGPLADQVKMIGNAVPPLLATAIGESLREDLARCRPSEVSGGALLSFVPTNASALSPTLQRVVMRLEAEFSIPRPSNQTSLWR